MTSRYPSVLHALSVEPRAARPGETVRVMFRTRNFGAVPSPLGTVRFLPSAGLEVVPHGGDDVGCGGAVVAVGAVPPGDELVAEIVLRVARPMDDGTTLGVQAVLEIDGASFGTNVCAVVVRSCAVLDGPLSGTFTEMAGDDTMRVRAVVTNEGDGPACGVRIAVPAPLGTVACDDGSGEPVEGAAVTRHVDRLEAGERVEIAFGARIVEPVRSVCADEAYVTFANGTRCAIPVRSDVTLSAVLVPPEVVLAPSRRRVDVSASVRNDGWADACDVRLRVALPEALRLVDGSVLADGVPVVPRAVRGKRRDAAFARLEKTNGTIVVAIGRVPARSVVQVSLAAQVPAGYEGGDIAVDVVPQDTASASAGRGDAVRNGVVVPFVIAQVHDVRVRIVDVPLTVAAGERAVLAAEISNLGDVPETVTVRVAMRDLVLDEGACTLTVQPGHVAPATVALDVPDRCDAARLPLSVVVSDSERERARAQFAVVVRDAASARGGMGAESAAATGEPVVAHSPPKSAAVRAVLAAPAGVFAGAPFTVSMTVDADDPVERLTVGVPVPAGATYVPGSTVLDGRVLLDRGGSSPVHGDGLTLRGLRGPARVAVTWSMLAASQADAPALEITALLDVDGRSVHIEPVTVAIRAAAAFSVRPPGLPYHLDARVVEPVCDVTQVTLGADEHADRAEPASPPPFHDTETAHAVHDAGVTALLRDIGIGALLHDDITARPSHVAGASYHDHRDSSDDGTDRSMFALRLETSPVHEIAHAMRGAGANTLISHVIAMRALLPAMDVSGSAAIAAAAGGDTASIACALDEAVCAARDVFDRLFVKLRIPGFGVVASDLEDSVMRRALVGLFRALGDDAVVATLADAPFGSADVLRALVTLVPARCDADPLIGAALRFYACALDEALARLTGSPLELFEVALARDAGFTLADARAAVVSALSEAALSGAA
jgi:hypothetical protein